MKTNLDEASLFSVAFQMKGDSMDNNSRWCFSDGDYLRCDEVEIHDIEVERDYVIKSGDSYLVRRVTSTDGEYIAVSPLNPAYEGCVISVSDIQQVFIVKSYQRQITRDID
ncbi:hypothetical protein F3B42_14370 [Bacteroides ovatus]|jgi:hypothetical protein|nr:hypothetical protein F3B42_14370 [Bacteroides ovatus]KAA4680767.1 hypothetical protein F3B41_15660 [Bacteroides ovatus]DAP46120.1 MAG TPA: hypothetical protein [Caudoviricetes sp.]